MKVRVEGKLVTLRPRDALGDGGEAMVFRHGDQAIKIYHQPCDSRRVAKLEGLLRRADTLPDAVVAPRALVLEPKGDAVLGFTMAALRDGHCALSELAHPKRRAALGVALADVASLFLDAGRSLSALHREGVVVGDLNDANELFTPRAPDVVRFIDVDSFQLDGLPCEVSTDGFLAPELYGPDLTHPCLTADGRPRVFLPEHDWYAFAVLLFRALTGVHPYGGVDPEVPSLIRRSLERRSVFGSRVRVPNVAARGIDGLSSPLRALFEGVFERGERGPVPPSVLSGYRDELEPCSGCGVAKPSSARACSACGRGDGAISTGASRLPLDAAARVCRAEALLSADGPIVAMACSGADLSAVARVGEQLVHYRVRGSGAAHASELMTIDGPCAVTVAGHALLVSALDSGAADGDVPVTVFEMRDGFPFGPGHRTSTERFGAGEPAFGVGPDAFYRIARGVLMAGRVRGSSIEERPIAVVMTGQTWLSVAPYDSRRLVCGSRALRRRHYFAWLSGRRVDLDAADLDDHEAITDETVTFGDGTFALLRLTRAAGEARVRTTLYANDGRRLSERMVRARERLAGSAIRGGVLVGARHLVATAAGLVRETLNAETAVRFDGSAPHCVDDTNLGVHSSGVACAESSRVSVLTLSLAERSSS